MAELKTRDACGELSSNFIDSGTIYTDLDITLIMTMTLENITEYVRYVQKTCTKVLGNL